MQGWYNKDLIITSYASVLVEDQIIDYNRAWNNNITIDYWILIVMLHVHVLYPGLKPIHFCHSNSMQKTDQCPLCGMPVHFAPPV